MTSVAGRLAMVVVVSLAAVASAFGVLIGLNVVEFGSLGVDAGTTPAWLAIGVATVAIAQLARLRVRVGNASVQLAWGEAAIVVLCAMLPPVWIPAVVLVGVALSRIAVGPFGQWRGWGSVANSTGAITLAGVAATLTAHAIAPTYGVSLNPSMVLALIAAAGVYTVVAAALVSLILAAGAANNPVRLFAETMNSKLYMIFGNVAVGLLIVLFCHIDWRFLALLPPMFWLLHQSYAFRLRGDDDRRTWQAFAEATGALNRLDERGAVQAGIRGALRLFRAAEVEVVITGPDGRARRYSARSDQQQPSERITDEPAPAESTGAGTWGESGWVESGWGESGWSEPYERPDVTSRRPRAGVAIRPLLVGGVRVGELRLRLPGSLTLAPRDQLMFAAYGDALAAAVHDAATHDELLAMSERNTYDAVHDPLTGLVNRVALMSRGNMVLRRQSPGATVVLLLLDINRFKDVNNTLGHPVGDELLRVVANRLAATCARGELLARLGGDEFALLVPVPVPGPGPAGIDVDTVPIGAEHAVAIEYGVTRARQLSDALSAPTEVAGVSLSVEASIGVVAASVGDVDMTELLRRADIAMYEAKRGGRSVAWYESIRDDASTDRLALLAELREALASREQLHILLQPAISLTTGTATGVEALVRWQHPRRGLLVPEQFLPAVEQSELIGPFTLYVLELAVGVAAGWRKDALDVPISVNLSARSLSDQRLPADIERLLLRYGYPPARLVLEITESVVVSPLPVIDEVLAGLRRLGVQLAVDDFGTGYSSLTFLTRVAVDEVKVDKAFVARMVDFPEAAAIVRTTVDLARQLGLRVTAEGVETAEQRAALAALGCTAGQGYHFFPPVPPERATRILQELKAANVRHLRAEGTG